jgi:Carboxypeptidase regulatory-like domain
MTNSVRAAFVLALLLQGLAAASCEDRGFVTGPTAPRNNEPIRNNVSISGVVYDSADRPLRGARVEVMEGTVGDWCHYPEPAPVCVVAGLTDGSGRFTFSGPFASVARLRASMDGYVTATLTVDSTTSNSAIEFRLEPSVAS